MKIVNLPTGAQKGIKGAVVNVPGDLSKVTSVLPRAVSDSGLVTLKLKRKLSYQKHVLRQTIRPEAIMTALAFLKSHDPLYTKISINPEWMNDVNVEDTCLFDSTDTISAELSDPIITSKSVCGGESEHIKRVNNTPEHISGDNSVDQFEPQPGCSHWPDVVLSPAADLFKSNSNILNYEQSDDKPVDDSVGSSLSKCTDKNCVPNSENMFANNTKSNDPKEVVHYDTCLQPENGISDKDAVFSITPGEGKTPLRIILDTNCEQLSFQNVSQKEDLDLIPKEKPT